MDRFTLTANLIQAIQNYLGARPFKEVANLMLALNQQIAAQLPPETQEQQTTESE